MSKTSRNVKTNGKGDSTPQLRKANKCFEREPRFFVPLDLFDQFWHEGELALFFGATGTGKSIFAMQLADALSRGREIDGFMMTTVRRKVLYVDLTLHDEQFQNRYSHVRQDRLGHTKYEFSDNLYRDRPPEGEDLIAWLRRVATRKNVYTIIIDDLSGFKRTHNGSVETLSLMRQLRQLRDELRIPILVLAGAREPTRGGYVSEADLGPLRVLCEAADSVFAIGRHPSRPSQRYLVQTRSRNSPVVWNLNNAPTCEVKRFETGMLGFAFDDRFIPRRIDAETLRLICRAKELRDQGKPYRAIADKLGISKSRVLRLCKKWTPAIGRTHNSFAEEVEDRTDDPLYFPGIEEYEDESDDERFEEIFDRDDVVSRLLRREYTLIESARCKAREEYKKTGETPLLIENSAFVEFKNARIVYEESGGTIIEEPIKDIVLQHHAPSESSVEPVVLQESPASPEPSPYPFLHDGSPLAEEWFQLLIKRYPTMADDEILRHYEAGNEWCRPPGAVPPYDPDDPFKNMKKVQLPSGAMRYVEEELPNGEPHVWYQYDRSGRLCRYVTRGFDTVSTLANPNLFGKWAFPKGK